MANKKDSGEIEGLQESMDMASILPDLFLPLTSRFSVAGKFDDDGIEFFLKETFLETPCKLSSSCPMDEEDDFSFF